MELEDLDNINKNDILSLVPLDTIKQESLDGVGIAGIVGNGNTENIVLDGAGIDDNTGELINTVCDSVEKQVNASIIYV